MCGFCNVWMCVCVGVCMCRFRNVWVYVCAGVGMCGCFGNMCTCIYRLRVFILICATASENSIAVRK
jgi:hypothetical protein